jgi:hypothetical protein
MSNTFKPISYRFGNSITIELTESKITAKNDSSWNEYILSDNVNGYSFSEYTELGLSPASLYFRFVGLSFIIMFIAGLFLDNMGGDGFAAGLVMIAVVFGINALLFGLMMIDSFLGLNLYRSIIAKYFSETIFKVTIKGSSGNKIDFSVPITDKSKIVLLGKSIEDLQNFKSIKPSPKQNVTISKQSKFEELGKAKDLLDSNLITIEEFNTLKKDIFNGKDSESADIRITEESKIPEKNPDIKKDYGVLFVEFPGDSSFLVDNKVKIYADGVHLATESFKNGFSVPISLKNIPKELKVKLSIREKIYNLKEITLNNSSSYQLALKYSTLWGNFESKFSITEIN